MHFPSVPRPRWRCALTLAALVSAHLSVARADLPSAEATVEQRREAAKAKYQQGADAYSGGHYKDAVDFFLAADRLAPSAPLSFNIARAYERLADDEGTLRWYRDYLRREPDATNAEGVRALIATLAEALQKKGVQQLTVLTNPAGATVTVDDQPLGVTPWTGELAPGKHRVLLSARGYLDLEQPIELAPDQPQDLSARLLRREQASDAAPLAPSAASGATAQQPGAPQGKKLGVLPWALLGTGAAALGGALSFEFLRRSAEHDAEGESTQLGYQRKLDSEQSRQLTARIFLGVGGAFAATGAVMLLLDTGASGQKASAAIFCLPGTCTVGARGRF
jgi:tetratricopeptide (TPR) repeat protein